MQYSKMLAHTSCYLLFIFLKCLVLSGTQFNSIAFRPLSFERRLSFNQDVELYGSGTVHESNHVRILENALFWGPILRKVGSIQNEL